MNQKIHKSFKLNGVSLNEQSLLKKITSNKDLLFLKSLIASWFNTNNYLEVKTSGSTGNPKKIKGPKNSQISPHSYPPWVGGVGREQRGEGRTMMFPMAGTLRP